jgi:hypothetical protein
MRLSDARPCLAIGIGIGIGGMIGMGTERDIVGIAAGRREVVGIGREREIGSIEVEGVRREAEGGVGVRRGRGLVSTLSFLFTKIASTRVS